MARRSLPPSAKQIAAARRGDFSILECLEAPPAPSRRARTTDHFVGPDTSRLTMTARTAIIDALQEGPQDRMMLEQMSHEDLAQMAVDEGLVVAL